MWLIFNILHKNFQEDQLNSRRFPGFPGFPGVVDTLITDISTRNVTHCLGTYIVRLDTSIPAHQTLKQVIAMKAGRCSGMNWRRLPVLVVLERHGYIIQQIGDGTTTSWKQMWQSAEERGHRGESSQRTTAVYAS